VTLSVYDPPAQPRPFHCPTKWEIWHQLVALLPRGRAWQTDVAPDVDPETGPAPGHDLSVMHRYWAAYASLLEYFHQRACAWLDELNCWSQVETRDWWHADYGFPDDCELYDDLCAKVAARGGATCAYIASVAASRGWVIACGDCSTIVQPSAVAGIAVADLALPGCPCAPGELYLTVYLAASPAYTPPAGSIAADVAVADLARENCPDIESLKCIIDRIKPAHLRPVYVTA
jgi:hypothetical protein